MEDLKRGGQLVQAGERMDGTDKAVRGKARTVTDGPYAEDTPKFPETFRIVPPSTNPDKILKRPWTLCRDARRYRNSPKVSS
jgi:hypothetical protein